MSRRRRLTLLAGAAAIVAAAAAACDSTDVHILSGQLFDTQNHCLGAVSAVDVVNGGATPDDCTECLVASAGDAQSVYVTTTCPPYAPDFAAETPDMAHDAADPCVGAFAAYDAGTLCSALDAAAGDAAPGDAAPSEAGSDASPADASPGGDDGGGNDGGSADGGADGGTDAPAD